LQSDKACYTSLRVEWAKAKARVDRWEEKVVLVNEEMRRIISYGEWKAVWWRDQPALCLPLLGHNIGLVEGLKAYGEKQAALEDSIRVKWTVKWKAARDCARPIIDRVLGPGWDNIEMADVSSGPETETECCGRD
jgi:hypothetical protein